MSVEYEARPYQPGDELQIVSLLKSAYQKWPFFDIDCSPVDHWKWRYDNTPQHQNLISLIQYNDKIVASGHNILNNVIINGKHYPGAYGSDLCVHPEFQGKGLVKKVSNQNHKLRENAGVKFTYMVTVNPKIIESGARKRNFPIPFPYNACYLSRIDDINLHIKMKDLKHEYGWKLKHYIERARSSPLKQLDPRIGISEVIVFDSKIVGFLEKVNEYYDFIMHRTRDYLNWRYCDPRAGNYNVRVAEENGHIIGYGVFRINKLEDYHTGYIVDLLTLPERVDAAEVLLNYCLAFFRENGVNEVVCQVIENHPYEELFNNYGFHGEEGNRRVFYNYMGEDDLGLDRIPPDRVHFSFGDLTGI
jgi:GNAT superfamily N-acetyltransferase